ncbi:MAG TPA: sulfite exporter TauE/SafE family protein [Stellaceae bacterium]|nr:sulfite exporter TauE/SafE family protein [Stellaceae bacterium]
MDLDAFVALCSGHAGSSAAYGSFGLVAALFFAGLAGSAVHCGPMCGPLVLAQTAARLGTVPPARMCELARLRSGILLPYHLGRLSVYAALGAAMAAFGAGLSHLTWFHQVSAALLAFAAGVFLWQAWSHAGRGPAKPSAGWVGRMLAGQIGRLGAARTNHFVLGLLLGFLPCGFLYAALAASAGAAGPASGAFGMLAFGLGTVPMLAAIGVVGHGVMIRWRRFAGIAGPAVMATNAVLLLGLAWVRLAA